MICTSLVVQDVKNLCHNKMVLVVKMVVHECSLLRLQCEKVIALSAVYRRKNGVYEPRREKNRLLAYAKTIHILSKSEIPSL